MPRLIRVFVGCTSHFVGFCHALAQLNRHHFNDITEATALTTCSRHKTKTHAMSHFKLVLDEMEASFEKLLNAKKDKNSEKKSLIKEIFSNQKQKKMSAYELALKK